MTSYHMQYHEELASGTSMGVSTQACCKACHNEDSRINQQGKREMYEPRPSSSTVSLSSLLSALQQILTFNDVIHLKCVLLSLCWRLVDKTFMNKQNVRTVIPHHLSLYMVHTSLRHSRVMSLKFCL